MNLLEVQQGLTKKLTWRSLVENVWEMRSITFRGVEVRSRLRVLGMLRVRSLFGSLEGAIAVWKFGRCDRCWGMFGMRSLFGGCGDAIAV
jgi:hypothetical protein